MQREVKSAIRLYRDRAHDFRVGALLFVARIARCARASSITSDKKLEPVDGRRKDRDMAAPCQVRCLRWSDCEIPNPDLSISLPTVPRLRAERSSKLTAHEDDRRMFSPDSFLRIAPGRAAVKASKWRGTGSACKR